MISSPLIEISGFFIPKMGGKEKKWKKDYLPLSLLQKDIPTKYVMLYQMQFSMRVWSRIP